jgi:hypothetical protein
MIGRFLARCTILKRIPSYYPIDKEVSNKRPIHHEFFEESGTCENVPGANHFSLAALTRCAASVGLVNSNPRQRIRRRHIEKQD